MANLTATTITGNLDVTGGGVISGDGSGLSGVDPFASGTKMVFYQASAPTGWTQDTASALGNAAMRVVTGTGGGTGGSDTFQTTFGSSRATESKSLPVSGSLSGTVGGTTLSTPTIASHSHVMTVRNQANPNQNGSMSGVTGSSFSGTRNPSDNTANAGGGGSHSHPFSGSLSSASTASSSFAVPAMDLKFANVIIAAKD